MLKIIAEVGVNHQGNCFSKKDDHEASRAGCDFVKFQVFTAKNLATKYAKKAQYQIENSKGDGQYEMLSRN